MKRFMFFLSFLILFFEFDVKADEKTFVAGYLEGRKIFQGSSSPWMSAYSDVFTSFSPYSSGKEMMVGGQYNFWGPFSVGAAFRGQWPEWSSRNNYYLGPSLQVKFGNSFDWGLFDITLRYLPLFDVKGGFGRSEVYLISVVEWKWLQVIPQFYYFWNKDFVWLSTSHQVTVPLEVAVQAYKKHVRLLTRSEYTKVLSQDKNGTRVGDVDVVTVSFGVKTENPVGDGVTLWGGFSAGPQWRSDRDGTGAAVSVSGGVLWR